MGDDDRDVATTEDPTGPGRRQGGPERLAKGLGWFSFALGVPQLLFPAHVARLIGVEDTNRNQKIMRAVGARELGGGALVLMKSRPGGLLVSRVAGDLLDLGLLSAARRSDRNDRGRVTAATAAVAGVTVLDILASRSNSRTADPTTPKGTIRARSAVTVNRPPDEVYRFWHDFENLPRFMAHLKSVKVQGEGRSRWVAAAPAGRSIEWQAEVTDDVPDQRIAWRSLDGTAVPNEGSVTFESAPGDRGTEVSVDLTFEPPGGSIGAAVARLFGEDPEQQIKDDLRRFKQVLETGEVVVSDGSPDGTRTQRQLHQREAQPLP